MQSAGEPDVIALLVEQRDLCRQLGHFAQVQRSLITGGQPERLLAMLGDRQQLLERMGQVGARLRSFQPNWPQVRAGLSPADAARADGLISEVNALLAGILKTDEADAELLSARRNAAAQDLGQVRQHRVAGAAYAAAGGGGAARVEWTDE